MTRVLCRYFRLFKDGVSCLALHEEAAPKRWQGVTSHRSTSPRGKRLLATGSWDAAVKVRVCFRLRRRVENWRINAVVQRRSSLRGSADALRAIFPGGTITDQTNARTFKRPKRKHLRQVWEVEAANELNLNPLPLLELFDLETPAVAVAIDAAGVALAAGGEDGMVAVWDIATGALSATYVLELGDCFSFLCFVECFVLCPFGWLLHTNSC